MRHDADPRVEFVLEAQRPVVVERRGHARKADAAFGARDAQAGRAPQRVLRLLHVAEVAAEMHDARRVELVEVHAAAQRLERGLGVRGDPVTLIDQV